MMMFGSTNTGGNSYWYEGAPKVITLISAIKELYTDLDSTTFFADSGTGTVQLTKDKFVSLIDRLKVLHTDSELAIIQEQLPTVKVFSVTYNGNLQTNQITAGVPTFPANKRLPVYDTNGVLQGYIDLNT